MRGSLQGALGSAQIANASVGSGGDIRFSAPVTSAASRPSNFYGDDHGNEMRGTVTVVGRSPAHSQELAGRAAARNGTPQEPTRSGYKPEPPSQDAELRTSRRRRMSRLSFRTWAINFDVGGKHSGHAHAQSDGRPIVRHDPKPCVPLEISVSQSARKVFVSPRRRS